MSYSKNLKQNNKELQEIEFLKKTLKTRDLELARLKKKYISALKKLDRLSKILAQRDLERSQIIKKREKELVELEESRRALLNILEDAQESKILAETEKDKISTIVANLYDGLLVFDKDNKLILLNPQAETLLGIKAQDILGKTFSELYLFPALKPLLETIAFEGKRISRKEFSIKPGLTLEISSIPLLRQKEGTDLGDLIILHDVTREKLVERMKTEFVSVAAHQLRTPLSVIKWTLKMILDRELGEINKDQEDFLQKIYQSNQRMISLINDLLNVARIEEGRYLFKTTPTNFEQIVQSVIESSKREIDIKKIKLKFEKPASQSRVLVDIEKITLVVQNLLDNAIKYTPEGGEVTISLRYDTKELEFSIKDTGIGIPKDQQERVFSRFFRATNAIKRETEGSGLGLFIVKNIIDAHGGRIWFDSEEGRGSTFYFTLPLEKSA
jgi:PAS domain S-box-containing protein